MFTTDIAHSYSRFRIVIVYIIYIGRYRLIPIHKYIKCFATSDSLITVSFSCFLQIFFWITYPLTVYLSILFNFSLDTVAVVVMHLTTMDFFPFLIIILCPTFFLFIGYNVFLNTNCLE